MWLIISCILFAVILLHVFIPKRYNSLSTVIAFSKIPGPGSLPFFDSALHFVVKNEEFLSTLVKFTNQYGSMWKACILGTYFLFLSGLEEIETILSSRSHITKGIDYEFLLPWLGTGLLISGGKKWFDHRKWLTPAFHFNILEGYIDIMNKNTEILCNILESINEKVHVEINSLISNCALDIICETAMGTKVNAQLGGEKVYVKSILRMSQIFTQRTLSPWLYRPFIFNIHPLGREHNSILKIVHGFTDKVIKERQLAYKEKQNLKTPNAPVDTDIGERKKMSFLDLLIEISETQNRLTQEEIREEVDTFMFEGHDTTTAALIWALYELGLNPEIQEKAYQEQCKIFGESQRKINYSDLQEMKYLEKVIKETLRLYPSVPIISRKLDENVRIRGHLIPAGTQVPIFIYYIHRNPEIYPEPEKFNPDRFDSDHLRDRHPYSFIPFSAGPRNCIGQRFAMMEEKVILSHLIRKFKLTTMDKRENVKMMGEIILRPKENIKMTFTKR